MRIMLDYVITFGVLITIIGFSGWTFIYGIIQALDLEDANRVDPLPKEPDNRVV